MGRPVFLVDNLFNPRTYLSHTLSASTTASGTSVEALSAGRRRAGANVGGWFANSLNTDAYVQSTFDRPRAFDLLFIDRDHNLAGKSVSVRISDDSFTTYQEIGPLTVPSEPVPMAALYDGQIIVTDEGALLWWLGLQVGWEVRVFIAAMGSGLRPELAGLMLGKSWTSAYAQIKPAEFGRPNLIRTVTRSPHAQSVSSEIGSYRTSEIHLRAESWEEYATARYHLEELYTADGKPMVVIHDDEQAERALLSLHPGGETGFEIPSGAYHPEIRVPIEETEPVLR